MSQDPWAPPPEWHHTVAGPPVGWPAPPSAAPVRWDREAVDAVAVSVVLVLLAPVAGLVWSLLGPQIPLRSLLTGSESGFRVEVGADFHFLVVTLVAGIACALAAVLLHRDGPGASLGLGVGGVLAALVAERVGYLANRGDTLDALHRLGVRLSQLEQFNIDPFFKVRALGVLLAWPLAALVTHSIIVGLRNRGA